jgi:hypothetical protein
LATLSRPSWNQILTFLQQLGKLRESAATAPWSPGAGQTSAPRASCVEDLAFVMPSEPGEIIGTIICAVYMQRRRRS